MILHGHIGGIYTKINVPLFDPRRGAVLKVTWDTGLSKFDWATKYSNLLAQQ